MTRTPESAAPTFAVRVKPKFREVVLPPGPAPLVRDRPPPDRPERPDVAPSGRTGPDRSG